MLNVVVLNGGRGAATLLPSLLDLPGVRLTSIVNAYDDGKSTGEIRRFFGMLGPSDLRKVQALMLPQDGTQAAARALFDHRFADDIGHAEAWATLARFRDGGDLPAAIGVLPLRIANVLRGWIDRFLDALPLAETVIGRRFAFGDCAIMNILYAGAFLACARDMEETVSAVDRLFRLRGVVLPNSCDDRWLAAEREDGTILSTEAEIVELRSNDRLARLFLLERPVDAEALARLDSADRARFLAQRHTPVRLSAGARLAIEQADAIIYSAGTQHSSLYPTYMSRGIAADIAANSGALKVFVTNIGADYETPRYRTSDFVQGALRFLRLGVERFIATEDLIHVALINSSRIKPDETYVDDDAENFADLPVMRIVADLESRAAPGKHDGAAIVRLIMEQLDRREEARRHARA
ncbi:2-phospho-L-lactate transferase CofD family protein [Sphingomonas abietis]|uniref:2-phospho-L-lactate transferase CofD family protein n=1 Tax=Sphingomonas abietis TaxID=3012344 RepID=A0ABY7NJL0_9SPHN|nr:2-phospho-L-lactate transferase CofD family protein [Sphingomonas abietis]WBO20818.1 2-phospho-L-lactate transferase CofD family protein [Sphingomonas abietis]